MHRSCPNQTGIHLAVIMDGNGRWAARQGKPRTAGHRAGIATVRRVIEAAPDLGVGTLTLYAFSADNWRRPLEEVDALMWLARAYLRSELRRLIDAGVRLTVIGRRDRLPPGLVREIIRAEQSTGAGRGLHVRIALDYSARESILRAAAKGDAGTFLSQEAFGRLVAQTADDDAAARVDLLIRTGGEKRLSDFLLWEAAYAELWFTDRMWPDFTVEDLRAAVEDFRRRDRRFGGLSGTPVRSAVAATA